MLLVKKGPALDDVKHEKVFKDSVHGYITIPKDVVRLIIDTPLFQRLRSIEQTGMRVLYPAARHDRFIHSLGVFCLGKQASHHFLRNVENFSPEYYWFMGDGEAERNEAKKKWKLWEFLFRLACLLHDCGHAPFSHAFEFFYQLNHPNNVVKDKWKSLKDRLAEYFGGVFAAELNTEGSAHERMSAFLVILEYRNAIIELLKSRGYSINNDELSDYLEFIVRMIIGLKYQCKDIENQIRNCFIELLNGNMDVDKLDYLIRDAQMSGVDTISIDLHRFLRSLTLAAKTKCNNAGFNGAVLVTRRMKGLIKPNKENLLKYHGVIKGTYREYYSNGSMGMIRDFTGNRGATLPNGIYRVDIKHCDCQFWGMIEHEGDDLILGTQKGWEKVPGVSIELCIAYHKSALSVLESITLARNYEYQWIHQDHTVAYYAQFLIVETLRECIRLVSTDKAKKAFLKALGIEEKGIEDYIEKENKYVEDQQAEFTPLGSDGIITHLLSPDTFISTNNDATCIPKRLLTLNNIPFNAVTDDDIRHFFKYCHLTIEETPEKFDERFVYNCKHLLKEFFSRNYCPPVWKSFAEYKLFPFSDQLLGKLQEYNVTEHRNTNKYGVVTKPDEFSGKRNLRDAFMNAGIEQLIWVIPEPFYKVFPENVFIVINSENRADSIMDSSSAKVLFSEDGQSKELPKYKEEPFYYLYYRKADTQKAEISTEQLKSLFEKLLDPDFIE